MYLDNYLKYLNESYFTSKEPLFYKFDEWEESKWGHLFITGIVASGKTTYSNELAMKYKCRVIHLDDLINKVYKDYLEKHPDIDNLERKEIELIIQDLMDETYFNISKIKEKIIIEGVQAIWMPRKELLNNESIILVRTSNIVSLWRSIKRNLKYKYSSKDPQWNINLVDKFWIILRDVWGKSFLNSMKSFESDLIKKMKN